MSSVRVNDLPASEPHRYLDLVPFFKELSGVFCLGLQVMTIGLWTDLDLLDLDDPLFLLGYLCFLALLVLEFTVIHDPANRWVCSRRNLNKVEPQILGRRYGVVFFQYAQLLTFSSNDSELPGCDHPIDSDLLFSSYLDPPSAL